MENYSPDTNDVISSINKIVFEDGTIREDLIIGFQGRMLIVIDDYESFTKEEASRISELITKLDVAHHKVVVTTRAANVCLGQEIKTNELTQSATIDFLNQVFENESIQISQRDKSDLEKQTVQEKIHKITSGRPIFIFQLAFVIGSQGLANAIKMDIKGGDAAIEFLYGRLYNYLSSVAKDVFVTIGLLTTPEDMMNVTDKLQYVLNMENDSDGFNRAFEELKKLKIVKTLDEEGKYFEVYSKELQAMMNQQLSKRDSSFIGGCKRRRDQINKDKNLDIEHSLLNNANAGRYAKNEIEVVESYKQLINRQSCPIEVKLQAISYLTSYLILERGKRIDALDLYDKYSHVFIHPRNKYVMAEYSLRWANAYWSSGSKSEKLKAISILSDYMKNGVDLETNLDLELMGTLLMFKSLSLLTEWRELRDKKNFGEISLAEFKQIRTEQMKDCNLIYSAIGNPLYSNIARKKLTEFPSGTRQAIITGLYNYIEVLIRIKKKDAAIEICDYVCICGPKNFHTQFMNRKDWLKKLS